MSWYVIRAATRRELQADASLRDAGFETYLPTVLKYFRLGRDKQHTLVQRPFLPGYLFAWIPSGSLRDALQADFVHGVVCCTTRTGERAPRAVSEAVLETVRRIIATGEFDDKPPPETKIGSTVRITSGPFADLIGEVKAAKHSGRLMVLLGALGAPVVPVEISEDLLEAVA